MSELDKFLQSFQPAVELFNSHAKKGDTVRIITHNDADGVSSGGILSLIAIRYGTRFKTSCFKKLDEKVLQKIKEENNSLVIFSDFGSSLTKTIKEFMGETNFIIFDHHLPQEYESNGFVHVNPLLFDIDGAREIASSGICYLFAKSINSENIDLAHLGLIGALGDQQDKGEKKNLIGINRIIETDAEKKNLLKKQTGLIFYGYETRPLPKAIAYTTIPYIPGLSGKESNCVAFLKKIDIKLKNDEKWRSLSELSEEENITLYSALSNHMVSQGCNVKAIHQLIGSIYTFRLEEPNTSLRSGREYASLLNACGRMGKSGVGLAIVIGDRGENLEEAHNILDKYRQNIATSLEWIFMNEKLEELEYIYLIRAQDNIDDTIIGVVSSVLLSQGTLKASKPIISTAFTEDNQMKVSARSTEDLNSLGLHIGKVLQEAAEIFEGGGGGHDIAAGAYIPLDKESLFIEKVNQLVREKVKN